MHMEILKVFLYSMIGTKASWRLAYSFFKNNQISQFEYISDSFKS